MRKRYMRPCMSQTAHQTRLMVNTTSIKDGGGADPGTAVAKDRPDDELPEEPDDESVWSVKHSLW